VRVMACIYKFKSLRLSEWVKAGVGGWMQGD
jgi:hypothetical protein